MGLKADVKLKIVKSKSIQEDKNLLEESRLFGQRLAARKRLWETGILLP